jgi:hypothetical protein
MSDMALTFVGAMSVATIGREEVRTMFAAAVGCNLAWGLADAVMYPVRAVTDRGRALAFIRAVQAAADAETGRRLIERSLLRAAAGLISSAEIEAIRGRIAPCCLRCRSDRPWGGTTCLSASGIRF